MVEWTGMGTNIRLVADAAVQPNMYGHFPLRCQPVFGRGFCGRQSPVEEQRDIDELKREVRELRSEIKALKENKEPREDSL